MAPFNYSLPEKAPAAALGGLSPEALTSLRDMAMGPSAAEVLLGGAVPTSENHEKDVQLEQARTELDAFATRLFPADEDEEARLHFTNDFKVGWDEEKNEPAIWNIDADTGAPNDSFVLKISGRGMQGRLDVPRALRIRGLDCSDNEITWISALPDGLMVLDCSNNKLPELPDIPDSLKVLDCSNNLLTKVPEVATLQILKCRRNKLTTMPTIQGYLEELDCAENKLQSLYILSLKLTKLDCCSNELVGISGTYLNLTELDCSRNDLTELPKLPGGLRTLKCDHNNLTKLPKKMPTLLRELDVSHNRLTKLPALPQRMQALVATGNPWRHHARGELHKRGVYGN